MKIVQFITFLLQNTFSRNKKYVVIVMLYHTGDENMERTPFMKKCS